MSISAPLHRCPASVQSAVDSFPISMLARHKRLYVTRGVHPVNDCLPCQRLDYTLSEDGGVRVYWEGWIDFTDLAYESYVAAL
jgi:hypothetical protein